MAETRTILTSAVNFVKSDHFSVNTLIDVSAKEYTTHSHSMDTAIVALGFANHLRFNNNDLHNLGLSAILHDIGKSRVDQTVINKEGTLTEDEFEQVKKHPLFGFFIPRLALWLVLAPVPAPDSGVRFTWMTVGVRSNISPSSTSA